MKKCLTLLFVSIFAVMFFSSRDARACSCVRDRPSALDEYERADHVIIAKIVGPIRKREPVNQETFSYLDRLSGSGIAVMTVEKTYKGGMKPGEKIDMVHDFTSCDPVFEEKDIGREFLLYLINPQINPPRFTMRECGRSSEVKSAAADILYLENLSSVKGKSRISGRLLSRDGESISDVKKIIIHSGVKTWELAVDSNGVYEIYDLPAGEYEIEPVLPVGWRIDTALMHRNAPSTDPGRSLSLTLNDSRHVPQDIYFIPDNTIRGRLLSPSGKPLGNVLMRVGSINTDPSDAFIVFSDGGASERTEKNGEFDFSVRKEGEYVLYVNNLTVTEDFPFGMLYYPGTTDMDKAQVFLITPGTFFNDLVFQVPKSEGLLKMSVTIQSANGVKITDPALASLQFTHESGSARKTFYAESLENGVFSINIPKGVSGKLAYSSSVSTNIFRNCPEKIDEPFKSQRYTTIYTNEVLISGKEEDDVMDVNLRIPAPCE